jgi:hypothetical protein
MGTLIVYLGKNYFRMENKSCPICDLGYKPSKYHFISIRNNQFPLNFKIFKVEENSELYEKIMTRYGKIPSFILEEFLGNIIDNKSL